MSPILLNAQSVISKIESSKHFVENHSYDIILITETWVTGYISISQMFPSGYKSFLTQQINRLGGPYLAHMQHDFSVSHLRHLVLEIFPDTLWLCIRMHKSLVHLGIVYQPPLSNKFELNQLTKAFKYVASVHGGAGDFSAPKMC